MARKKKHEEHQNHEAWAIPYGDLVTLLFALFTVMYAMSSVNEGKYRILSDSLVAAFRGAPTSPDPVKIGEADKGKGGDAKLSGVSPTALMKLRDPRPLPKSGEDQNLGLGAGKGAGDRKDPRTALFVMADEVRRALQDLIDRQLVRVRQSAFSLEVEIKTDILFPSGVATVAPTAVPVIEKVAEILKPFPNAVRVEGHTDDRPIRTALFPSNWELSAARAANVVQLFTRAGIEPNRMEVLGLGEQRPVADNATTEGRNANRRVVIVVVQAPDDAAPEKVADGSGDRTAAPAASTAAAPPAARTASAAVAATPAAQTLASVAVPDATTRPLAGAPATAAAPLPTVLARSGGTPR
jgi:chemotaxis protein MotB